MTVTSPSSELYAGVKREAGTFPVQYLGANVPQAWAAGSVFHLLRALLGLDADAHRKRLYIHPELPRWLPEITVHKLRVGTARIDLRFWRDGETTRHEALAVEGERARFRVVAGGRAESGTVPGDLVTGIEERLPQHGLVAAERDQPVVVFGQEGVELCLQRFPRRLFRPQHVPPPVG